MTKFARITLLTLCLFGALRATTVSAVDQAAAAADLANVSAIAVQAKVAVALAALSGDVDAVAEAQKRSDAVDDAMVQAKAAYADVVSNLASGNEAAAQSASIELKNASASATNAANGVSPEEIEAAAMRQRKSRKTSAGGPGRPYDPPNIYDVPWNSQSQRAFYQSQFGNFWQTSSVPTEQEATPE